MFYCTIPPMSTQQDFPDWLQQELQNRGWNQAELARRGRLTTAQVSRIMTGEQRPGPVACQKLAHALRVPAKESFAGLVCFPGLPHNLPAWRSWPRFSANWRTATGHGYWPLREPSAMWQRQASHPFFSKQIENLTFVFRRGMRWRATALARVPLLRVLMRFFATRCGRRARFPAVPPFPTAQNDIRKSG